VQLVLFRMLLVVPALIRKDEGIPWPLAVGRFRRQLDPLTYPKDNACKVIFLLFFVLSIPCCCCYLMCSQLDPVNVSYPGTVNKGNY